MITNMYKKVENVTENVTKSSAKAMNLTKMSVEDKITYLSKLSNQAEIKANLEKENAIRFLEMLDSGLSQYPFELINNACVEVFDNDYGLIKPNGLQKRLDQLKVNQIHGINRALSDSLHYQCMIESFENTTTLLEMIESYETYLNPQQNGK